MHRMQALAAIDVGSDSCRLKIARIEKHRLKVLHQDREVTRLGASVFDSGMISPDAMASTLRALKRFYKAVQAAGADRVRAMRAVRRRLSHGEVRDRLGPGDFSGLEEARLIHRGVMLEHRTQGRCLLVDLGGGSCEITLSDRRRIVETMSLPLGAVRLTEEFLRQVDPPAPEDINYQGHHRHTQYAIAGSELYGFTPQRRAIVSGIARYLGKSRPVPQDRAFRYIAAGTSW